MTERLENSEAAFHSAFTDAPVAMAFIDVAADRSEIRAANGALVELLGYTSDQLVGRSVTTLLHREDLEAGVGAGLLDGSSVVQRWELRVVRSDGSDVWVQLHVSMLERRVDHSVALAHLVDITERKEIEASRERYETQIELMSRLRLRLLQGDRLRDALDGFCVELRDRTEAEEVLLLERNPTIDRVVVVASSGAADRAVPAGLDLPAKGADSGGAMAIVATDGPLAAEDEALFGRLAIEVGEAVELSGARSERQRFELLADRERIATDLHDVVIQRLFAAGMRLQAAVPMVGGPARDRLEAVVADLDTTIAEIRDTIFSIHHPERAGLAWSERVAEVVAANADYLGFRPELRIQGSVDEITEAQGEQLVPALTEILSNVARHAEATSVQIDITVDEGRLELEVTDDGIGIEPHAAGGNGLGNLARRALALGGGFTAASAPVGGGTVVRWWVAN